MKSFQLASSWQCQVCVCSQVAEILLKAWAELMVSLGTDLWLLSFSFLQTKSFLVKKKKLTVLSTFFCGLCKFLDVKTQSHWPSSSVNFDFYWTNWMCYKIPTVWFTMWHCGVFILQKDAGSFCAKLLIIYPNMFILLVIRRFLLLLKCIVHWFFFDHNQQITTFVGYDHKSSKYILQETLFFLNSPRLDANAV